jgi:putative DNA primase/helicase
MSSPVPSEVNDTTPSPLVQVLEWRAAGFSTIPIKTDGSKGPSLAWKPYQVSTPTDTEIQAWWGNGTYQGVAVVCGQVSGNVEMLELEMLATDGNSLTRIENLLDQYDAKETWDLLHHPASYCEWSPSGGTHYFYRISDHEVPGNTKVARRPATAEELAEKPLDKLKVLVETRGEGGYVIVAPTAGVCHPSGEDWVGISGSYGNVPTITWKQRNALHAALKAALDEMPPEPVRPPVEPPKVQPTDGGTSPGDDWEARGDLEALLTRHGWTYSHRAGEEEYWVRPGKSRNQGHSATWNYRGSGLFYVFSSAVENFESEKSYSKFGVYAALEHRGDFSAAAKALSDEGYGVRVKRESVVNDIPEFPMPEKSQLGQGAGSMSEARLAEDVAGAILDGKFCWTEWGWFAWDGKKWAKSDDVPLIEATRRFFLAWFNREVKAGCTEERRKVLNGLLSRQKITSIVSLTKGILWSSVLDFDTNLDLLNTPSGVVDLRTGELLPHDPKLRMTKMTSVPYVPGASHLDWVKALDVLPVDCHAWIKERLGQAVTGYMPPDDRMIFCQGGGENGKSSILGTAGHALGDYYVLMMEQVLAADRGGHNADIVPLRGARLVVLEELPEGAKLNVQRLKKITTPKITARPIYGEVVEFPTTHSGFISTNFRPTVSESDWGTWRRLTLIKFPYLFRKPGEELTGDNQRIGDPGLRERLTRPQQLQACLAWMVEGAKAWYAQDRVMTALPKAVDDATSEWRQESDLIFNFWTDHLVPDNSSYILSDDLWKIFDEWLKAHGHFGWSPRTFIPKFMDHDLATRNGVSRDRVLTENVAGLSRPATLFLGASPARSNVFRGLRFINPQDQ